MLPAEISPTDLQELTASNAGREEEALVIDCREQEEYDLVHLAGAKLLPMSEIQERLPELAGMEERRIIVYCHLGVRSFNTVAWLRQQGFSNAQSLAGGIDAWAQEIEPEMRRY